MTTAAGETWSWRLAFLAAGILIGYGGAQHPRDPTMAEMLANPTWFMSHAMLSAGFAALLAGLWIFSRSASGGLRRATTIAMIGTALQLVEMIVHTASMVDHGNLVAGRPTPVLTTHLAMTIAIYPIFAAAAIAFIVSGMRHRAVGSAWIAWLGIAGAAAHGLAALLAVALEIPGTSILFPMLMLFALWLALAALWPSARPAVHPLATSP